MMEMQKLISAENSDLFDVLALIAFATPTVPRQESAERARHEFRDRLEEKQRAFVEFVLGQYVAEEVDELDLDKLAALLKLKYWAVRRCHCTPWTTGRHPTAISGVPAIHIPRGRLTIALITLFFA